MSNIKQFILRAVLCSFMLITSSMVGMAQISLSLKNRPMREVIKEIEKVSDFRFFYNDDLPGLNSPITVEVKDGNIERVLEQITKQASVSYVLKDNSQIVLSSRGQSSKQENKIISGLVTDLKGEPVIGANVVEKGTTNGTITDLDGRYSLSISSGQAVLQISYIGYNTLDVPISGKSVVNAALSEDTQKLDEVVVVSYGTQKKRDLTGSISKVNADDLSNLPVGQLGQKLQGQVAGVQINQVSGQPGQGLTFRIRGAASVNGGNEPLFVVDGMPITSGLNNINPDEIESFSVLKDAAATSLYGSRAANGVVLITTKRGKGGRTEVSFNASYGVQTVRGLREPDVMNGQEQAQYMKEFYEDKARYEGYTGGVPDVYQHPEIYGEGTNWFRELTRTAPVQNYSLSVAAGKDKFSSAVVLGYFKQEGVLMNTGFERYSLRANNDLQVNKKIKIGLNIAPTFQIGNNQGVDGHRNVLGAAIEAPAFMSPYDKNGDLTMSLIAPGLFPQVNWIRKMEERVDVNKTFTVLSNIFAEVDIWKGIKYKFQAGLDLSSNNHRTFNPSTSAGSWSYAPPRKATGAYETGFNYNWTIENMLMYNGKFGEHAVDALLGYTAQRSTWEGSTMDGKDFTGDEIPWMDAAATKTGTNRTNSWSLASVIGRVNYGFKDRYLLQATFRRDGCSRFGKGNKWANFPSVSAGWIISDESFMESFIEKTKMNYLKLRASYGLTGNYNIGNYRHIAELDNKNYIFGNTLVPGKAPNRLGNDKLTWEETSQLDLGVDLSFLNDRIYIMYDFYQKKTNGMLYPIEIPSASGFQNIDSNMGDFKSWGHELTVTSRNLIGEFKWTTNLNLSRNQNKILKLGTNNTPVGGYGLDNDFNRLEVGQPIGVFYGYVFDGIYQNQQELDTQAKHATSDIGTARMLDVNGDGVITDKDKAIIGDPNPDLLFGMTNEFSYKNFDLSILISGQIGGDLLNANYQDTENLDGVFNVRKSVKDRWRSPEQPGDGITPRTKSGTTELFRFCNTHWLSDASFLTVKNITLGYTIPFKPNDYLSKVRVYFTCHQLATWTKYTGLNPEVSSYNADNADRSWKGLGVDLTTYPIPRSFSVGCNITF